MSEKLMERIILGMSIGFIVVMGLLLQDKQAKEYKEGEDRVRLTPPTGETYQRIRTYDVDKQIWIWYTDEEVRIIRERLKYTNPKLYIHTPGRRILSIEDQIEEYIDDNIEDIIDDNQ